ncbi:MAG: 16S rRNA (uracil(1498)-N(3))-methyltransferase [Aristaeellaceae bacterium]
MNSFYIEGRGEVGATVQLKPEDARHCAQVLRMERGEEFYAVGEGGGRFLAELCEVSKESCTALLREALSDNESGLRVTVYQGLPKADKLELVVQKLTELGAARLVPVKMERCVVKLNDKDAQKKQERLQKIAREAAKQCKRGGCLEVAASQSWKQLRDQMAAHDLLLVPWEDANNFGLKAAHEAFPEAKDVGIVIGPEGGMSEAEVRALEDLGAKQITLGPRILRTETAAIAAATMAMLLWGDIG